jgi:hypothetical protein
MRLLPVFILPVFVLMSYTSPVSRPKVAPLQLFYSSGDLSKNEEKGLIDITRPFIALDQRIKLTYKDHHTERVPDKDLWGFSDAEGNVFRYFEGIWEEVKGLTVGFTLAGRATSKRSMLIRVIIRK